MLKDRSIRPRWLAASVSFEGESGIPSHGERGKWSILGSWEAAVQKAQVYRKNESAA